MIKNLLIKCCYIFVYLLFSLFFQDCYADIQLDLSIIPGAVSIVLSQENLYKVLDSSSNIKGYIYYSPSTCNSFTGINGPTPLIVVMDNTYIIKSVKIRENNEPQAVWDIIQKSGFLDNWNELVVQKALSFPNKPVENAEITSQAIIDTFQKTLEIFINDILPKLKAQSSTSSQSNNSNNTVIQNNNTTNKNIINNNSITIHYPDNNKIWSICNVNILINQLADKNATPVKVPQNNISSGIQSSYSGSAKATKSIQNLIDTCDKIGCGNYAQKIIEEIDPLIWSERIKNEQRETRKIVIIITFLIGIAVSFYITYLAYKWWLYADILLEPIKLIKQQIIAILQMPGGRTLFVMLVLSFCSGTILSITIDTVREWLFFIFSLFVGYYIRGFSFGLVIILAILLFFMWIGCFCRKFVIFDGVFVFFAKYVWLLLIPLVFIIILAITMHYSWKIFQSNIVKSQYVEACIKSNQSKTGPTFDSLPQQLKGDLYGFANLSEYIYNPSSNNSLPKNIKPLSSLSGSTGYDQKTGIMNDSTSGLGVQALQDTDNNNIILVFKGTEPTSLQDWYTNFIQYFMGKETAQYSLAVQLVTNLLQDYPSNNIILTGHSLGGGLAQYSAAYIDDSRLSAICFNSAGLSDSALERIGDAKLSNSNNRIIQVRSTGDIVSEYGWHLGTMYNVNLGAWANTIHNNSLLRAVFSKIAQHNITIISNVMKLQI